jgi:hypothetical protein
MWLGNGWIRVVIFVKNTTSRTGGGWLGEVVKEVRFRLKV